MIRRAFLTGPPGVGKTTLIGKLHQHFVSLGVMVSGIITEEVRSGGVRTGFRVRSLMSGEEGWLATKSTGPGPRIGSYIVNTKDLERIGAGCLRNAARGDAPLVLIDEIGPMEMTSTLFREGLLEVFKSDKTTAATVRHGSHYEEVESVLKSGEARTFELSRENRDSLLLQLTALIQEAIR